MPQEATGEGLGPGGAVIQAVTWGLKARVQLFSTDLLRSGLGASERPSQPQPLLGLITHHSPQAPQSALTWELAILPWERWLISGPSHPFIRRDPWSVWQEPHHCRDL